MVKIYGYSTFNPLKVVITAEELGIDYDYVFVDLSKRENMEPEHLERHPFGKVPALEVDGQFICESAAICRYLAVANDYRLYSRDPLAAAKIDQLMDMMSIHIGRWLSVYFWEELIKPKFFKQDPDPEKLEEAAGFLSKQLPYLDSLVTTQDYLTSNDITIADIFTYAYMTITDNTSVALDPCPNLKAWYERMGERPAVQKAVSKVFG